MFVSILKTSYLVKIDTTMLGMHHMWHPHGIAEFNQFD